MLKNWKILADQLSTLNTILASVPKHGKLRQEKEGIDYICNTYPTTSIMTRIIVHPDKVQLKVVKAFLKAIGVPFEVKKEEKLSSHASEGIKRGQEDIKAGRSLSLDQFAERISSGK